MQFITEQDAIDQYDEMLNEVYPDATIAGMEFTTAHALAELDPTAYRCGMIDYLDAQGLTTDESEAEDEDEDEDEA